MKTNNDILREILEADLARALTMPPLGFYRCPEEFVLKHGTFFFVDRYAESYTGLPRHCFGNAIALCVARGYRYVEGYALAPAPAGGPLPLKFHHAWNLTKEGKLFDSTWRNTGLAYAGVEFCVGRADDATWNGDASVLDDWKRHWPLLQQEWKGEDPNVVWKASPLLATAMGLKGKTAAQKKKAFDLLRRKHKLKRQAHGK